MIRTLLVDDSVVARRMLMSALGAYPEVEVVATAPTGSMALARLDEVQPDAIVLDVEMPGLDGVETLRRIRERYPRMPVVMFSALTDRGAEVTVRALAAGASDYVCKPSAVEGRTLASVVEDELVPKLLALCGGHSSRNVRNVSSELRRPALSSKQAVEVLVIASSTGGPNALDEMLALLPADLGVPVAIVQHMPPVFTRYLADRLNTTGPLRTREASDGELMTPGQIWVAPGDCHLELERRGTQLFTKLTQDPPENSCRPAADVLFRSAARVANGRVLAVVLTGMGQDGLVGARAIVEAGGSVLTQDRASCVVWGMPKAVEQAGLADEVLPLRELARAIGARCGRIASVQEGYIQ